MKKIILSLTILSIIGTTTSFGSVKNNKQTCKTCNKEVVCKTCKNTTIKKDQKTVLYCDNCPSCKKQKNKKQQYKKQCQHQSCKVVQGHNHMKR